MSQSQEKASRRVSLKSALAMGFIPVLMLLIGCTVGSMLLNNDMHERIGELSASATTRLRYAQHTAANLETVSHELMTIAFSPDRKEAREAYITAWQLLSESALDRFEETRTPLFALLKDTRRLWVERQQADASREAFNEAYRLFYLDFLASISDEGPMTDERLEKLARDIVERLELPPLTRYKSVRDHITESCGLATAAGNAGRCPALRRHVAGLDEIIKNHEIAQSRFEQSVANAKANINSLKSRYAEIESRHLVTDVEDINRLTEYFLPLFFALLFSSLVIVGILLFGYRRLIRPLQKTAVALRLYMKKRKEPDWPEEKRIREIQEIIGWSQMLVSLTANERRKASSLQNRYDLLLERAQLDSLTGVVNRAGLDDFIREATEVGTGIAVIMVDIDHFKDLNDRHGHQFGDRILRTTAEVLRSHVAEKDTVYRYGGEEFCIVLSDVNSYDARDIGERLCRMIRTISRESGETTAGSQSPTPLTASIGVSSVTHFAGEKTMTELIGEADKALYLAKNSGRNRVMTQDDLARHSGVY